MLTIFFFCYSLVPFITRIFEGRLVIKRHISFDHGPPVGSHSAGLAGVLGYLFAILHFSLLLLFFLFFCLVFFLFFFFTWLFQSAVLLFVRAVVLSFLSFFWQKKTKRDGLLETWGWRKVKLGFARTVKRKLDGPGSCVNTDFSSSNRVCSVRSPLLHRWCQVDIFRHFFICLNV